MKKNHVRVTPVGGVELERVKGVSPVDEAKIDGRSVSAVVGRVGVVDRDNELIVASSYKVGRIRASSWMHNSMPLSKVKGWVSEVVPPVGWGEGRVDGDLIIGEVEVLKNGAGDEFLEQVCVRGSAICRGATASALRTLRSGRMG